MKSWNGLRIRPALTVPRRSRSASYDAREEPQAQLAVDGRRRAPELIVKTPRVVHGAPATDSQQGTPLSSFPMSLYAAIHATGAFRA